MFSRPVVPEVDYRDIRGGSVSEGMRQAIRRTGCAIVRGVFPETVASGWFAELGEYLEANDYEGREVEKRGLDQYFSALKAGKPQIFNVYWSKPQVMARQDPRLAETRAFLDRLWAYEGVFDPDRQCTYADRVRRLNPARRQDARPLAAHGRRHRRAVDRSRLPEGVREGLRRRLAPLRPVRRDSPLGDARAPLARRVQHVPHLSGLDGADAAGPARRDAAAHPDRRRHLLRAPEGVAGRRRGG